MMSNKQKLITAFIIVILVECSAGSSNSLNKDDLWDKFLNFEFTLKNVVELFEDGTRYLADFVSLKFINEPLDPVSLSLEILGTINRWWKGEISGKRCSKIIVDSLSCAGGRWVGGAVGAGYGAAFGPLGFVAGGVIGSIVGCEVFSGLSNWLTNYLFDLPKDIALENAYNFLGLNRHANNFEINKRYRELCLKYHPDKGGNAEDFQKLQLSMSIIKISRGEKINF